jgi:hypothetical protein
LGRSCWVKGWIEGKVEERHVEIVVASFVRGYTIQYRLYVPVPIPMGAMNAIVPKPKSPLKSDVSTSGKGKYGRNGWNEVEH